MIVRPLLSIIVPIYNVEKYIEQCVDSIISQDLHDIEVIFVDDGSQDDSIRILQSKCRFANTVKILFKDNGGLSDARNFGLAHAEGEYIWFVDADDIVHQEAIRFLKRQVVANEYPDAVFFSFKRFSDRVPDMLPIGKTLEISSTGLDIVQGLFNRQIESYSWSFICRKSIYASNNIFFPVGRAYEDMATTYRLFLKVSKVIFSNSCLYAYRNRPGSISNARSVNQADDLFSSLADCEHILAKYPPEFVSSLSGDFQIYYALLAYQASYRRDDLKKIRSVYGHLKGRKVSLKYLVGYFMANFHLLRIIQGMRVALKRLVG